MYLKIRVAKEKGVYKINVNQGILKAMKKSYEARLLNIKDIKSIINLQNTVYENLINKSNLEKLTKEEYNFILSGNGLIIGIYVKKKLIALRALLDPGNEPEHLGLVIGLSKQELDKVIYQEISFVHPDYQGNNLQKIMANLIMKELNKKSHSYSYVCATVAPDNIPSLKDKFSQEMEIRAFVTIYGEKQRYVFVKEFKGCNNNKKINKEIYIDLDNVHEAKKHLSLGWKGIELCQESKRYFIKFTKYKCINHRE